jgi:hypothetical protein
MGVIFGALLVFGCFVVKILPDEEDGVSVTLSPFYSYNVMLQGL